MPCAKCHKPFKRGDTLIHNPLIDEEVEDIFSDKEDPSEIELVSVENLHLECAPKWLLKRLGLKPTKKVKPKK